MKRKYIYMIIAILLTAGGFIMFTKIKDMASLYDSDHKFKRNITLEKLRTVESAHGPLIRVTYSHGGGMQGDTNYTELYRDKDGKPFMRTSAAAMHYYPLIVHEYTADEEVFTVLRELIDRDNLSVWEDLPMSEFMAMDAPSTIIEMYFDDSELGGRKFVSSRISYDYEIPEGGYDILNHFVDTLHSYIDPGRLTDAYFNVNGEKVITGRDIVNTDEEIEAILSGYWNMRLDKDNMLIGNYGLHETLEFRRQQDDGYTDAIFSVGEIVHEPYGDSDCGWYITLKDEEDIDWVLYIENLRMVLRRADGSQTCIFEREA